MIISHAHRLIFLKTNKTAGTSLEIALSRHCGEADIITPISAEDELIRKSLGGRSPQHYVLQGGDGSSASSIVLFNHAPSWLVKDCVGAKWNTYFKFCFERNPWDRVLSFYFWRAHNGDKRTLTELVHSQELLVLKRRGSDVYRIDGKVAVDRIFKFENIDEACAEIGMKLGLSKPLELPRAKSGFRTDHRHYREIFSDQERAVIAERFRDEIEMLGYVF